jgi:hypothetical protein
MEQWIGGLMSEYRSRFPIHHYSNTPLLHYPGTPFARPLYG